MIGFLKREANLLRQDFHGWQARVVRKRQGLSDLFAARSTLERDEAIAFLRRVARLLGTSAICSVSQYG